MSGGWYACIIDAGREDRCEFDLLWCAVPFVCPGGDLGGEAGYGAPTPVGEEGGGVEGAVSKVEVDAVAAGAAASSTLAAFAFSPFTPAAAC